MTATPLIALLLLQGAQPPAPDSLSELAGVVRTAGGQPVSGANVFIETTLEGGTTDGTGSFRLRASVRGDVTLIVRAIGYALHRERARLPRAEPLSITLAPLTLTLETITVEAGRHVAGSERGASLTALEVSSIPGARGDIARAFQTLPGVQTVDEGTGMFVRGGDSPETKVFLNGAELADPQRTETPLGSVATTVDPFLLEGITFSTGAFSVRFGNALSAIADLRTSGRPRAPRSTLHASLASVSGRMSRPFGSAAGIHATANFSDSRYSIALNGSPRRYDRAPHSRTVSGSAAWQYRDGAELKIFAIDRANGLRVWADGAGFSDISEQDEANSAVLLTWADRFGSADVDAGMSLQRVRRAEKFGSLDLVSERRSPQLYASFESPISSALLLRAGMDLDDARSDYNGQLPLHASDNAPGRPVRVVDAAIRSRRTGLYGETELRALQRLRMRAGVRTDHSELTVRRTWDPRASVTYHPGSSIALVLAAGIFHQLPDPIAYGLGNVSERLPAMSARQLTAGLTAGPEERLLRVEVYERRFSELVQLDRDRFAVSGGSGSARGADVFARMSLPSSLEARAVYSLVHARRTDPQTLQVTAAAFDVRHSALLLVEKGWRDRFTLGAAYRFATGRPFTPVVGANLVADSAGTRWVPLHGTPYSERLPSFHRFDLSAGILHAAPGGGLVSTYVSLYNLLDRENVAGYRYSADFSRRLPVRSTIGRGVFFGVAWSF